MERGWRRELLNRPNCCVLKVRWRKGLESQRLVSRHVFSVRASPQLCCVFKPQSSSQSLPGSLIFCGASRWTLPAVVPFSTPYSTPYSHAHRYQFLSILAVFLSELACFCQLRSHFLACVDFSLLFSYHLPTYPQLPLSCSILHSFTLKIFLSTH